MGMKIINHILSMQTILWKEQNISYRMQMVTIYELL